jgi:hypothetical protein
MNDEKNLTTKKMLHPFHGEVVFHERGPDAGKGFYLSGPQAGQLAFEYENFKPIPLPVKPPCNYATEDISPKLGVDSWRIWQEGVADAGLVSMVGCIIVKIGSFVGVPPLQGGGLAIEYKRPGSDEINRVVFEFNDLGMWRVFPKEKSET